MEWIKIDTDNLPKHEVLCANFEPRTYGYREKLIGYLSNENGDISCESESEMLEGCTHFIDINKFDLII